MKIKVDNVNCRSLLSVIAVISVFVLAATAVPALGHAPEAGGARAAPDTISLSPDPFRDRVDSVSQSISGEVSIDFRGRLTYATPAVLGDIFPDAPAECRGMEIDVVTTVEGPQSLSFAANTPGGGAIEGLSCAPVYGGDGSVEDVEISYLGHSASLRSVYDPLKSCNATVVIAAAEIFVIAASQASVTLSIPVVGVIIFAGIVALALWQSGAYKDIGKYFNDLDKKIKDSVKKSGMVVATTVVSFWVNVLSFFGLVKNSSTKTIERISVVDGIDVEIEKGTENIVSVIINNSKCTESWDNGKGSRDDKKYHFAYLEKNTKTVKIYAPEITSHQAMAIMSLGKGANPEGAFSIWSYQAHDAWNAAFLAENSRPVGPEIHGTSGYFYHYHTASHSPAHAFFGGPVY